jgi:anti-anti-sigma regulatory factor
MSDLSPLPSDSDVELSILYEIASAARRVDSLEHVFDLALDKATRLLGAEIGLFYLYDQEAQCLRARAARGVRLKKALPEIRPAANGGLPVSDTCVWTAAQGAPPSIDPLANQYPLQATLGLPIKNSAALLGWLYVARLKRAQFAPHEVSLYSVLANQVAAALETTLAWDWLRRQQEDLATAKRQLEQALAEVTAAYQRQERLVKTVRDLSTPVLPVDREILLIPIIGHIDEPRSQLIKEQMLEAISQHQASVAILDLTGIAEVDEYVVQGLMQATRAAQLLGAYVILSGISPRIARVMVEYDLSLRVPTTNNLQTAMAKAFRIVGRDNHVIINTANQSHT